MPDETSPAGSVGSGDDYGRFMASARGGFSGGDIHPTSSQGSIARANGTLISALNSLSGKIDSLIQTMGGGTFSGVGGGSPKSNGGGSTFMGQHPMIKWGAAAATLGAAGFSQAYSSRMDQSLSIYPYMQQTAMFGGGTGQQNMNVNFGALRNGGITRGTTGAGDTASAAAMIAQMQRTGFGPGSRGNNAMGYSSLTANVMGESLSGGASTYAMLRSPQVSWGLRQLGMGNFVGAGMTNINPVQQAMGIVSSIPTLRGAMANPTTWAAATQDNTKGYAALQGAVGGSADAANFIRNAVQAQLTLSSKGGGALGPNSSYSDLNKAGISSIATQAMQKAGIKSSQQGFGFSQSQETNIAATLGVQMQIRDKINTLVQVLGPLGRLTPILGGLQKAIELVVGMRIAANIGGGLGMLGEGAAMGGGAELLGPAAAAIGGGALVKSVAGKNRLANTVGMAAVGAGVGSFILPGVGTAVGGVVGAGLGFAGIGDPPTNNNSDATLVSTRNNTGHPWEVSGLQGSTLHDVASMMRANPRLRMNSGYRTLAQQKALYAKSGGNGMVAPPGQSMHEKGLAVDLGPPSEYGWLKSHGGKYGMVNYAPEPWHWEPRGASSAGNRTDYGISGTAPASTSTSSAGSFTANMSMSGGGIPAIAGSYGSSQAQLMAARLGSATEQGGNAYHYSGHGGGSMAFGGGASSASSAAASSSGVTAVGKLPTGGDKRVPGHTIVQWAHDTLTAMGVPVTPQAMDFLVNKWAARESGGYNPQHSGGLYNPLNSTESHFGYARNGGAQGDIKDYASYDQGVRNIAWNLSHTKGAGYDKILAALKGTNESAMGQAVDSSRFGTHGLGDPPAGGGGGSRGGTLALHSSSAPVYANFNYHGGGGMTQSDAKKYAGWVFEHIQTLQRDTANRGS